MFPIGFLPLIFPTADVSLRIMVDLLRNTAFMNTNNLKNFVLNLHKRKTMLAVPKFSIGCNPSTRICLSFECTHKLRAVIECPNNFCSTCTNYAFS